MEKPEFQGQDASAGARAVRCGVLVARYWMPDEI
jgi:hypothetical protein